VRLKLEQEPGRWLLEGRTPPCGNPRLSVRREGPRGEELLAPEDAVSAPDAPTSGRAGSCLHTSTEKLGEEATHLAGSEVAKNKHVHFV